MGYNADTKPHPMRFGDKIVCGCLAAAIVLKILLAVL